MFGANAYGEVPTLESCSSAFEPACTADSRLAQVRRMNASTSQPAASAGDAFHEVESNDTRCHLLKRYQNMRVIGSGAQGLVL